ncbi:hypothetical protein [Chitinophaga rhizophila]|uniref:DUF541 domain-containing protein n=1 Tax=Chitinophaga rhizophila TaxID=2866212 RepID=A0ABS7GL28_9BACT|nr:hypothetical protein [Chitinophaga rhizophila]MBW8687133.1 hypothetical protein [Chitinophaga rhizophila]
MFITKPLIWCLCLVALLCTSCFEVIEDITVKKDGSGAMKLTVNFSQSRTKIAALMVMDSVHGRKVPDRAEIEAKMQEAAAKLRTMNGISNVTQQTDFNNYIATISFSFRNTADINNLTKKLLAEYDVNTNIAATYAYDQGKATFTRDYKHSGEVKEQFNKLKDRDKEILKAASYISIFRFEQTVSSYSNQAARLAKNQLAVMQRLPLYDLVSGKADISNQIQLSR